MKIPIYQVDAFTSEVFGGNPAAVCPLNEWIDKDTMQKIAMENNLSETAFFVPKEDYFEIRWFTPKVEINLAGHPTLASAWVIYNELKYKKPGIRFKSPLSGDLIITKDQDLLIMDFPSNEGKVITPPVSLVEGLGAEPVEVLQSRDLLVIYKNQQEIENIKPDFGILEKVETFGIIVSAPGDDCDFVSRFFAPRAGINEDPVTGSAHTTLIPYWAQKSQKNILEAIQLSPRRGKLKCEYLGNRVSIGGTARLFMKGVIVI
ncbi:MAG: PhzF family phenazine biosynthesis protein [Bacteroidales bacterium]|jgi:predicted PhzF superfamily epimerase YddE/YHI9|nr:PhzF family phenazine biosynthesis protein [Bacteroidales bacterium]